MGKTRLSYLFGFVLLFFVLSFTGCSQSGSGIRFNVPLLTNWTKESGLRLTGGVSTSTIRLPNGKYRIFFPKENGIGSAISDAGLIFTSEDGLRVTQGSGTDYDSKGAKDPDVVTEDGYWRMYYTAIGADNKHRVMSAISANGLDFTKEPGRRIDYSASYDQLADVQSVVKISANNYKMYFVYDWYGDNSLKGATSTDGLNWTVMTLTGFLNDCMDPEVVVNDAGGLIMFFAAARYGLGPEPMDIYKAVSTDGVSWTVVGSAIQPVKTEEGQVVGDPDIIKLPDNTYRMYYYGRIGQQEFNILSATAASL